MRVNLLVDALWFSKMSAFALKRRANLLVDVLLTSKSLTTKKEAISAGLVSRINVSRMEKVEKNLPAHHPLVHNWVQ